VVYDEAFTSVTSSQSLNFEKYWNDLYLHHRDHYVEDFFDQQNIPPLNESWLTPEELQQRQQQRSPPVITANSPIWTNSPSNINVESNSSDTEVFHDALESVQPQNLLEDLNTNALEPTSIFEDITTYDSTTNLPTIPESTAIETSMPTRPHRERKKEQ
jgi:hypothetical protein